jgi:hypothetical protein
MSSLQFYRVKLNLKGLNLKISTQSFGVGNNKAAKLQLNCNLHILLTEPLHVHRETAYFVFANVR